MLQLKFSFTFFLNVLLVELKSFENTICYNWFSKSKKTKHINSIKIY